MQTFSRDNVVKTTLVFLLVGVSTMPMLKQQYGVYLLLASAVFTLKELRLDKTALLFLLLTLGVELYHNFAFDGYDLKLTRTMMMMLIATICIIYYVGLDLLPIYIKLLYYASLISFVFVALYHADSGLVTKIANAVPGMFVKTSITYGSEIKQANPFIYNFDANFLDLGRNNGPFWEPTVFATMLIIAQVFNLLLNKKLFNKQGIVFTLAIATTSSTTGFVAYFILILFYFLLSDRIRLATKLILAGVILAISIPLYTKLDFLSEKIQNEIDIADYEADKYGGDSRMASAILDLREMSQQNSYIFFGRGMDVNFRIEGPDKDVLRNCGDTALLSEWGVIYTLIYLSLLFYSFLQLTREYGINRLFALVFTLIILVVSFSEVFFTLPFFLAFLFFGPIIKKQAHVEILDPYTDIQPA